MNVSIRIQPATADDYRQLLQAVTALNMQFHSYQLTEDKPLNVVLRRNEEAKGIFKLTHVCGINVTVESKLCHRCQLYGHDQRNCHAATMCVKCARPHTENYTWGNVREEGGSSNPTAHVASKPLAKPSPAIVEEVTDYEALETTSRLETHVMTTLSQLIPLIQKINWPKLLQVAISLLPKMLKYRSIPEAGLLLASHLQDVLAILSNDE
ncbi:hypothetical protein Trydic_g1583 [Trypoxylus dichotomus]